MSNALTSSEHLSNLALLRNCSTGHFTTQPSQPTWTLKLLLFGPKSITQFYLNYCTWGLTHLTEITHVPYGDRQAETGEEEEKSGPYFQHHSLQTGKYQRRKYRIVWVALTIDIDCWHRATDWRTVNLSCIAPPLPITVYSLVTVWNWQKRWKLTNIILQVILCVLNLVYVLLVKLPNERWQT